MVAWSYIESIRKHVFVTPVTKILHPYQMRHKYSILVLS
jgi:hypothetical protein